MTNNIGTTSFSITIVTHYRPRSKFCANGIFFSWQLKSHNIKIFNINLTEHLKDVFPTYIANIETFKHVVIEIWALKENCVVTMKKRQHWNAFCHLTNDYIIMLCLLWWKTNKNFFFWLLQNYYTFSKHKMLNL